MTNELNCISINFCEPEGDVILSYDINDSLSALIPSVGDEVNIGGAIYRKVIRREFIYSSKTINVRIYLSEVREDKKTFSFFE